MLFVVWGMLQINKCYVFLSWNGTGIFLFMYISVCPVIETQMVNNNKQKQNAQDTTKCTNTMQLMQAHNATSTTACWAITKTNKQTHAKEKNKKLACVNGNFTRIFFFFFCYWVVHIKAHRTHNTVVKNI